MFNFQGYHGREIMEYCNMVDRLEGHFYPSLSALMMITYEHYEGQGAIYGGHIGTWSKKSSILIIVNFLILIT